MDKLQKDAHSDAVNKVIQTDIQYAVAKNKSVLLHLNLMANLKWVFQKVVILN